MSLRQYQRMMVIALIALVSLLGLSELPISIQGSIAAPPTVQLIAPSTEVQRLVQAGIDRYESEQFAEAVEYWQQALAASPQDPLNQAFIGSNLSLAYQQLGRWQEADQAITHSLNLLHSWLEPDSQPYLEILAKALNTQGRLQWSQGLIEAALTTWQQAAAAYERAGDRTGLIISWLNQAYALQSLGFSVRAEAQLTHVEQVLEQETDLTLHVTGLRNLGNALRRVGKLQNSQQVLKTSLQIAGADPTLQSEVLLDLGNTERALGNKALAIGEHALAQTHLQSAQSFYQQATARAPSQLTTLRAQLNLLSLLVELEQTATAIDLADQLRSNLINLPPNRSNLYAQLNYAKSVSKLLKNLDGTVAQASAPKALAQFLANTLQQAKTIQDTTVESYGLGQLGELYEQMGQWQEAQSLTQQALLKAEVIQTADVRYRWEWQLGRLQEKQGDRSSAVASYQAAVKSLQTVRSDLLTIGADVQFSFRDDVEPVYRELVELLLTTNQENSPSQANLKQAIQQVNALQLAELNNFLSCNIAQVIDIGEIETDATAAKLYPMILPNKLAIVLELPGADRPLLYHEVPYPRADLLHMLQQLRSDLSASDRTPEAITSLQQLHQWLIAPFQAALGSQPIKTLVFVLDGELRNVPMSALYDGGQYLISHYAVAVAPRLELFQPNPRSDQLHVFLGGVGESQILANRRFPEIQYLTPELEQIQKLVNANPPLLNKAFTTTNLAQQLQASQFSAVHLKTHGIFSSDPEATFIVAYQELITGRDLGRLIQVGRLGEASSIELLVLSACSTAEGDNRAVLGLAGVAIQAGARSVVSTLWEAQDLPNTQLMIQFYQALLDPGTTRAEALRQAQIHLLEQGYTTPHIWATYVLVGNWL